MASCDLCGKDSAPILAKVEGVEMSVCTGCAKFGEIMRQPSSSYKPSYGKRRLAPKMDQPEYRVVRDYSARINTVRKQRQLTQEEFAKLLNEKTSIVNKMEAGSFRPGIGLAKKMEKLLSIKLLEVDQSEDFVREKSTSAALTIGDMLNKK